MPASRTPGHHPPSGGCVLQRSTVNVRFMPIRGSVARYTGAKHEERLGNCLALHATASWWGRGTQSSQPFCGCPMSGLGANTNTHDTIASPKACPATSTQSNSSPKMGPRKTEILPRFRACSKLQGLQVSRGRVTPAGAKHASRQLLRLGSEPERKLRRASREEV